MQAYYAVAARLKHHLGKKAAVGDSSEERLNNFARALTNAHRTVKHQTCKEPGKW